MELARHYGALTAPFNIPIELISKADLLESILGSRHFRRYPPSVNYQRSFWKYAISVLESRDIEVDEVIYDHYLNLLSQAKSGFQAAPPPSYVTHFYSHQNSVRLTLFESRKTIENGTTGLRTWYSSFSFAEWLLRNPDVVQNKQVLELGCGVGFMAIIVASLQLSAPSTPPGTLYLTDSNAGVLSRCQSNLELECNNLALHPNISYHLLDWADARDSQSQHYQTLVKLLDEIDASVILGSDAYDPTIIPHLLSILTLWFSLPSPETKVAYIALSIRNPTTFQLFMNGLDSHDILHEEICLDLTYPRMFLHGTEGPEAVHDVKLFRLGR